MALKGRYLTWRQLYQHSHLLHKVCTKLSTWPSIQLTQCLLSEPRLLMAVLPNMIRKAETGNVLHSLVEICQCKENICQMHRATNIPPCPATTFPTHPVASAATRIFASHAPLVFEMSFWQAHVLRIRAKYTNDHPSRTQALVHWLRCLLYVLK
jgi:hypothetical protein